MKRLIDKNIILLVIPLAILAGIAYMTTRPGGVKRDDIGPVEVQWDSENIYDVRKTENLNLILEDRYAVFTVKRPSLSENKVIEETVVKNRETGNISVLKYDTGNVLNYKASGSGGKIGFLASEGGKYQLYSGEIENGDFKDIKKLSHSETGVVDFEWSPDGKKVAYTERRADSAPEYGEEVFAIDGRNMVVIDESGADYKLSDEDIYIEGFSWSPDGERIAYEYMTSSQSGEKAGASRDKTDMKIREVEVDSRAATDIAGGAGAYSPIYSYDGNEIIYSMIRDTDWASSDIMIYDRQKKDSSILIATENGNPELIGTSKDGRVFFSEADGTETGLYYVEGNGSPVEAVKSGSSDPSYRIGQDYISYTDESSSEAPESWICDLGGDKKEKITDENERLKDKHILETEVTSWKSPDGTTIEGILSYPMDYSQGEEYPLIIQIGDRLGGRFTDSYVDAEEQRYPFAVFSEEGYLVLRVNTRGSDGYGSEFRSAAYGNYGKMISEDIVSGVEHLSSKKLLNEDKISIMAWGYGSYNASIAMAESGLFKSAVLGAPIFDLESFLAATEDFQEAGRYFGEDSALLEIESISNRVDAVGGSVLILHGMQDRTVPYSEGLKYYRSLLSRGKESKMIGYPEGDHQMESPKLRKSCIDEAIKWSEETMN